MRKWIIATALLLTVPMVGAAAVIYTGPEEEQLVEGHTVFSVIQVRKDDATAKEEFAAAVAVLVRENIRKITYTERFPGVLWFNDQYLVNPMSGSFSDNYASSVRYLCGAVIAVNDGDHVPLDENGVPIVPNNATLKESYKITDPNDEIWDVDRWEYDGDPNTDGWQAAPMWSVATKGAGTRYMTGDDGKTPCSSVSDNPGCSAYLPITDDTPQRPDGYTGPWPANRDPVYRDDQDSPPGDVGGEGRFGCRANAPVNYGNRTSYNAVLYFFLEDLTDPGTAKDHGAATTDVAACQPGTYQYSMAWPCPGGDDNAEGYSHRYNPEKEWPDQVSEGRGNHGGSTGCGPNVGGGPQNRHATCNIDIYFGRVNKTSIPMRTWRVFDTEGSTAPYHCHDDMTTCNEEEFQRGL